MTVTLHVLYPVVAMTSNVFYSYTSPEPIYYKYPYDKVYLYAESNVKTIISGKNGLINT